MTDINNVVQFFQDPNTKEKIVNAISKISKVDTNTEFEKKRNIHILNILKSMNTKAAVWDELCFININNIGNHLINLLSTPDNEFDKITLDNIFLYTFKFLFELYLSYPTDLDSQLETAKSFGVNTFSEFDERVQQELRLTINNLPSSIFKELINHGDIQSIRNYNQLVETAKIQETNWRKELKDYENRVNILKDTLQKYENAFNFVGLYDGFNSLSQKKEKEKGSNFKALILVGILMVAPSIIELSLIFLYSIGH